MILKSIGMNISLSCLEWIKYKQVSCKSLKLNGMVWELVVGNFNKCQNLVYAYGNYITCVICEIYVLAIENKWNVNKLHIFSTYMFELSKYRY